MKRKLRRILMILAGIYVMSLIAASLVIIFFFLEMLRFGADAQSDATTEFFATDTYITMLAYGRKAEMALSNAEDKLIELEQLWSVTGPG